jgi:hypothetical protein
MRGLYRETSHGALAMMRRTAAMFLFAALLAAAGCASRTVYRLTDEKFRPTPANQEIKLYVTDVAQKYQPIGWVQSRSAPDREPKTKNAQLKYIVSEARKIGADAIVNVRMLRNKVRGAIADEAVPLPAWQQGEYERYFMRGLAIRYVEDGEAEPANLNPDTLPVVDTIDPEADQPMESSPRGLGPTGE